MLRTCPRLRVSKNIFILFNLFLWCCEPLCSMQFCKPNLPRVGWRDIRSCSRQSRASIYVTSNSRFSGQVHIDLLKYYTFSGSNRQKNKNVQPQLQNSTFFLKKKKSVPDVFGKINRGEGGRGGSGVVRQTTKARILSREEWLNICLALSLFPCYLYFSSALSHDPLVDYCSP